MANEFIVKNGFKSQGDSEVTGSFTATSGMSGSFSGSFEGDGSGLSNVSLPDGVVSGSAQISYTGITDVPSGIVSSSAQIATDISGAFGAASASFSTRVTDNETNISTLTAATASYILTSQTSSMSVATASYVEQAVSSSFASTASYVNTLSQQVVISDSTTSELLRITQTGTGDAIRIEDTSNPDATPTVINNAGDMFIGSSSAPESGGGNSPKLYVKNGSSGYTGNLAIDTAMLFEGAGSTYFATLSPDNSFGGLYMGSPSDVFGAFVRWRHDDARLQIGAAKTNHGIEFTVGNKGATSMQLKPDATGTGDYNATLTVTGSLIVSGSNSQINTTAGVLYDGSSVDSVRYAQRGLFSSNGSLSVQYDTRKLYNTDGTTIVFDWTTGDLNDNSGILAVDLGERTLNDRFGNEIASWSTTAVSYFSGSLVGTSALLMLITGNKCFICNICLSFNRWRWWI